MSVSVPTHEHVLVLSTVHESSMHARIMLKSPFPNRSHFMLLILEVIESIPGRALGDLLAGVSKLESLMYVEAWNHVNNAESCDAEDP